jgi:hypothetical protein
MAAGLAPGVSKTSGLKNGDALPMRQAFQEAALTLLAKP